MMNTDMPKVVVMTPMKNVAKHLPHYFELFNRIDYPRSRLRLAVLEGDSNDGTQQILRQYESLVQTNCAEFRIVHHNHGIAIPEPRWLAGHQKLRRGLIAAARNRLISSCLGDSDWVLWLDADLQFYPSSLIHELLRVKKNIAVPICLLPNGSNFDLNTFIFNSETKFQESPTHLVDGIFQPPKGVGRRYLDEFTNQNLVRVDSVGGSALLINANLHREGLIFPTYSYHGYIETEGLAAMAHDMHIECWGLPRLQVIHVNE